VGDGLTEIYQAGKNKKKNERGAQYTNMTGGQKRSPRPMGKKKKKKKGRKEPPSEIRAVLSEKDAHFEQFGHQRMPLRRTGPLL